MNVMSEFHSLNLLRLEPFLGVKVDAGREELELKVKQELRC